MPDAKVLSSEEARVLDGKIPDLVDTDPAETADWLGSLDYILKTKGPERVKQLLKMLDTHARKEGVDVPMEVNTPYINTIPVHKQPAYPGNREIERRIKSIIRWNAMAMVQRANKKNDGIGGHISTFASSATKCAVEVENVPQLLSRIHLVDLWRRLLMRGIGGCTILIRPHAELRVEATRSCRRHWSPCRARGRKTLCVSSLLLPC